MLRVLLCSPPKAGKTVAAVMTSPQPVFVFNTDGEGGLDPVVGLGGKFTAENVTSVASFDRAMAWLKAHLREFETVVLDNITGFATFVEMEVRKDVGRDDPRVIYPEYTRRLMKAFDELRNLPRNLIIIGHLNEGDSEKPGGFGHVLGVAGAAKTRISMTMQDWVYLHVEVKPDGSVTREFLLAPEGNWTKAARSVQGKTRMNADFTAFIALMESGGPKAALQRQALKAPKAAAPVAVAKPAAPAAKPQQQQRPVQPQPPVKR
jgi:hypothetical protein